MDATKEVGFGPVFDENSLVLILGSFPSVKSRAEGFYYGNKQNRFWKMLSAFFGETLPRTIEDKLALLHRHRIALWDMVEACEIEGSQDAAIKGERVVDLNRIFAHAPVKYILCNGTKSFELLADHYPELLPITQKMPSTSPANPRYSESVWHAALGEMFAK